MATSGKGLGDEDLVAVANGVGQLAAILDQLSVEKDRHMPAHGTLIVEHKGPYARVDLEVARERRGGG
jgi:hypothetical protein